VTGMPGGQKARGVVQVVLGKRADLGPAHGT
jgi:hypothetical protein